MFQLCALLLRYKKSQLELDDETSWEHIQELVASGPAISSNNSIVK